MLITLRWLLCFLSHVLSKTSLLSASQAVQREVWVSEGAGGGGMCEKREGTRGGRGEGRREREAGRMMGQVWNLHTLLVANTIDTFTSA